MKIKVLTYFTRFNGKWSELRKSERRKPKRTPKIDFRRSDLL
jgi:hypothetical protein